MAGLYCLSHLPDSRLLLSPVAASRPASAIELLTPPDPTYPVMTMPPELGEDFPRSARASARQPLHRGEFQIQVFLDSESLADGVGEILQRADDG